MLCVKQDRHNILVKMGSALHERCVENADLNIINLGRGCQHAVLRIEKGGEMREICGTFTDQELSNQAVVSDGPREKIQ